MKHRLLGIAGGVLLASSASAIPYQSNNCANKADGIVHPDNAQGVLFDEDCRTAYVLPPETGTVSLSNFARTANLGFCPAVLELAETSSSISGSIKRTADTIEGMIADFEPQEERLNELRKVRDLADANYQDKKRRFDDAEMQLSQKKNELVTAKQNYNTCTLINSPEDCNAEAQAVEAVKNDLVQFITGTYNPILAELRDAETAFDIADRDVKRLTDSLAESLDPLFALLDRLYDLETRRAEFYKEYAPMRALDGQLSYRVRWAQIQNEYRDLNRDSGLFFTKVPLISARVASSSFIDGTDNPLPVLLHASIPGSTQDHAAFPSGETPIEPLSEETLPQPKPFLGPGDAGFSGQITLSNIGACPYFPEGPNTPRSDTINHDELSSYLVVNALYTYPIKTRRKYTARYNLSQFVKRVEKKKKKGGFFSAKNIHSIIEDGNSSDWFTIKFDANDPEFNYTPAEQEQISRDVKLGLIERAMTQLAMVQVNKTMTPPPLMEMPKETGAGAISSSMRNNSWCRWYSYCRVGSWIIGGLDSIFGRKETVSNFKRTNNVWVTDTVDQVQVMERTTGIEFTPLEN
ncbi:hypothetical protein [Pseudobacteriovorax antillogorgiicola]|nr:hypothetical protein [Pseudobacteriovorax antillogorgiicola]